MAAIKSLISQSAMSCCNISNRIYSGIQFIADNLCHLWTKRASKWYFHHTTCNSSESVIATAVFCDKKSGFIFQETRKSSCVHVRGNRPPCSKFLAGGGGGTYLGWGVTYLSWGHTYLGWGLPTLAWGYLPWPGVPTLARVPPGCGQTNKVKLLPSHILRMRADLKLLIHWRYLWEKKWSF